MVVQLPPRNPFLLLEGQALQDKIFSFRGYIYPDKARLMLRGIQDLVIVFASVRVSPEYQLIVNDPQRPNIRFETVLLP